jgi:hypothetical protein
MLSQLRSVINSINGLVPDENSPSEGLQAVRSDLL